MGKHKFNRQSLDYLLTDLLPYEKGNHYTHRYFYEYINKNKRDFNRFKKNILKEDTYFSPSWHAMPHQFKISKKEEFRVISLINPLGLIQSLLFIELFEKDIINITHSMEDFSVRKASRRNDLSYKKDRNQTVYYTDGDNSKKQLLITLESSGTYFYHSSYKSINKLRNSSKFEFLRDKYDKLLALDIQNCFPSIYSHSFKWLISNKVYDSKNLSKRKNIYSNIDQLLQNLNGSKTNGIIVGPELSRLLVDFLLIHIDSEIIYALEIEGLRKGVDYEVLRFVDDYYIFTNNNNVQSKVQSTILMMLDKYHMKLKDSKIKEFDRTDVLNEWFIDVRKIINELNETTINKDNSEKKISELFEKDRNFSMYEPKINEMLKMLIPLSKKFNYSEYKNKTNIIINKSGEDALITSYLLSTLLKKVERSKSEENIWEGEVKEIVKFAFFLYSRKVTYSSTQKIVRLASLLLEKDREKISNLIEENIERFEGEIFNSYPSDWIDLLLFFSSYDLNLSLLVIKKIDRQIFFEENPINLAAYSLFLNQKKYKSISPNKKLNEIVLKNVSKINWTLFFQDKQAWWVLIFLSFPQLDKDLRNEIKHQLNVLKNSLSSNDVNNDIKKFIFNFLLNEESHFIEWNFTQENYYENFFFYTRDRTVFNPDILDQLSISR